MLHRVIRFIWRRLEAIGVPVYRFEYWWAYFKYKNLQKNHAQEPEYDLVIIISEKSKGWANERMCLEIEKFFDGKVLILYTNKNVPSSKAYFVSHHRNLPYTLLKNPHMRDGKILTWFTHPTEKDDARFYYALNLIHKTVCTNSKFVELLNEKGVIKDKLTYVLGGADPDMFKSHKRGGGAVGFCTGFYPRKNPGLIIDIIKKMPNQKFILIGPKTSSALGRDRTWPNYESFDELVALENLEYVELEDYSDYPKYYTKMDVYVSASKLEGGPIPIVEAMMSNVVPVVSNTGFAEDIITHGENGLIFDVDAKAEDVLPLIETGLKMDIDVRKTVKDFTWKGFTERFQRVVGGD